MVRIHAGQPIFLRKMEDPKKSAQNPPGSGAKPMKFPKRIKFRGENRAIIYGKKPNYPYYHSCYSAGGKRFMKSLSTYSEALAWAEEKAREVASGSWVAPGKPPMHWRPWIAYSATSLPQGNGLPW